MTQNADSHPAVARSVAALREAVAKWRAEGLTVALVPTMGALHEGHLSLVRLARQKADKTVASIFVNPTQFSPSEDFDSYPRTEETDLVALAAEQCDLVFMPPVEEMYPPGESTRVTVEGLSEGLCGASRPHFFGGVATVVAKLFNQCRPDIAVFGEKDYQQLLILRRMARDLSMGVEVIGAPIVREADGLAMSSRNAYLSDTERRIAGALNRILKGAAEGMARGVPVEDALAEAAHALRAAGYENVDYLEVRNAETLEPSGPGLLEEDARIFGAAYLGKTRLIDNMAITAP